jgi:hypothetical protein
VLTPSYSSCSAFTLPLCGKVKERCECLLNKLTGEMIHMSHNARRIITDILLGAVAGAAASWAMAQTTRYLYGHENERAKAQEREARGSRRASGAEAGNAPGMVEQGGVSGLSSGGSVAVEKAADVVGRELSDEGRKRLEVKLNLGLSMGAGAAYALLRHRVPAAGWGRGLAFGALFWLLVDEVGNTVLGLTPPPNKFPWQTHMRGLIGHLVLGLVTETVLELSGE